jgi:hypothetical protein
MYRCKADRRRTDDAVGVDSWPFSTTTHGLGGVQMDINAVRATSTARIKLQKFAVIQISSPRGLQHRTADYAPLDVKAVNNLEPNRV